MNPRIQRMCFIAAVSAVWLFGQPSVLTWHNDNARTGQNLQEVTLTPANVNPATFGRLFTIPVDGKVDAQPLYVPAVTIPGQGVHNVLFVVTEHDSAYAFDADTATQLWHVSLLASGESPSDDRGCGQVVPEIGATATPAIDPRSGPHGTIYVVAMSKDSSPNYHQRLHALDVTTGGEQFGGPVEIQATYPGSGIENTFLPRQHKERAALAIANGLVYTAWSSHCDIQPYTSWIISYNESTLAQVNVLNLTPNGSEGAMWGAGAGPAIDGGGNLYVLTGNGTFDPSANNYGNAFVKMSTSGGGLAVADYFTMFNTQSESGGDQDLGSGGLIVLPPVNDAQGQPRSLAVGAGKDAHIYVVDRNNLGKFNPRINSIYQDLQGALSAGMFSAPAWFDGKLYYGAVGDKLKAFTFTNGVFPSVPSSLTGTSFVYPGTTPSISANGTSNAIVWAAENAGTAVLHAYDATDLSKELYNSNQAANGRDHFGSGNKFIVPTIANGKVYVGTTNSVGVFGLFCPYSLSATNASAPAAGGTLSVNVIVSSGCAWTATSNSDFVSVNSGSSGTGNGTVTYQVTNNSGASRSGTLTIAGLTFTVTQAGIVNNPPQLNLSIGSLNFGFNGTLITGSQDVTISFSAGPAVAWTASSNQSNITVNPASGMGNGVLHITAAPGPSGVVTVSAAGAGNRQIQVNVRSAASDVPFGSFDTPADNSAGIAGAIPVTGWALDPVDIRNVDIWREPVAGEPPNGLVFIGDAVFVTGARPDVEASFPNAPRNNRGGWGYQLLTSLLPNNGGSAGVGNGIYKLHAIAHNTAGLAVDLGTRTITVDNAHTAKPFGTIDTPGQGSTISGNAFVNFAWALTQNPFIVPTDGSTIAVIVDGQTLGHPVYNQFRSDVAAAFPDRRNSSGPVGYFILDTTKLSNGVHTIQWVVFDSAGHGEGLGSRYFTVLN
jgi:Putative binding domain, N-terminal